jgi:hypothetical protein
MPRTNESADESGIGNTNCGWLSDDRARLDKKICNNLDVNLGSLSLTIDLSSPCRQTISLQYIHDSLDALILMWMGMRL